MVAASRQILLATETTSKTFRVHRGGQYQVICTGHAGGTWLLQIRVGPGEDWISTGADGSFTGNGIKSVYLNSEVECRFHGGTKGAKAYIVPTEGGRGHHFIS